MKAPHFLDKFIIFHLLPTVKNVTPKNGQNKEKKRCLQ